MRQLPHFVAGRSISLTHNSLPQLQLRSIPRTKLGLGSNVGTAQYNPYHGYDRPHQDLWMSQIMPSFWRAEIVAMVQKKAPERTKPVRTHKFGRNSFGSSTQFNHKVCQQLNPSAKL